MPAFNRCAAGLVALCAALAAFAQDAPSRKVPADAVRPPRSALSKASPAEVAEWIRVIAGRPLNRAEAASLLRDCGIDVDSDPALGAALDSAMETFRTRWDAFSSSELIPVSDQRGTSLADLAIDPARSAAMIIDLRTRRHGLEDSMLDDFAQSLPEAMRPRVELAKAARGSQVPVWATGSLMPAGSSVPIMSLAWDAQYVPDVRRDDVRHRVESALAPHAAQRSKLMDGLLRATLEADLMSDRVAIEVQQAARAAQEAGAKVDSNVMVGIAMSRQLLPAMCAAGDAQAANARALESLKGALEPGDFDRLMQAYAKAASVPLPPQLDPDVALANAAADGSIVEAQREGLAHVADAWRRDDADTLMSWAQSLPELSRSMCAALGEMRWDDPEVLQGRSAPSSVTVRVQQRQMQLLQSRSERASSAIAAMKALVTQDEWDRIRPTKPITWGEPKGSTP
jgi:hypothetical protein